MDGIEVKEEKKVGGSQVGTARLKGMRVCVSEEVIAKALPANSGHCMISDAVALAAKGKGWKIGKVLTDLQTIRFTDLRAKRRLVCFTPRVGQLALLAFDQGKKPEPFEFRLKPVQVIEGHGNAGRKRKVKEGEKVEGEAGGEGEGEVKPPRREKKAKARMAVSPGRYMKIGGSQLPTTIGLRREFGLRQMGVYQEPDVVGEKAGEEAKGVVNAGVMVEE